MTDTRAGDFYILLFALCQGATFVFWRYFLEILPVQVFMVYWFGLAVLLVGGHLALSRKFVKVPLRHWPRLILFAMLSGLTAFLYMTGIHEIGASLTAIVLQAVIIFTIMLAVVFLGERPSRHELAGVALIMGGHVVLNFQAGPAFTIWVLVIVAGTACQALAHFIAKGLVEYLPGEQVNLFRLMGVFGTGLVMLLVVFPGAGLEPFPLAEIPLLVLGVLIGPFSFLAYYRALKRMNLTRSVFLMNTQPVFTITIAYLALGEVLTLRQGLAGLLVLAGVYVIIIIHGRRAEPPSQPARVPPSGSDVP